jgi:hypothetical protein
MEGRPGTFTSQGLESVAFPTESEKINYTRGHDNFVIDPSRSFLCLRYATESTGWSHPLWLNE